MRASAVLRYYDDPAGFIRECFVWRANEGPAPYQLEIAENLIAKRRISMRGPHGLGKTALSSWLVLWFALTREAAEEDWKIPTTASAWRQLSKFLWPELHKWVRKLDWQKIGRDPFNERSELLTLSLKLKHGEAFALASDDPNSIEGAHADQLLYLFDESKAISDATFDAAEGAFSQAGKDTRADAYALMFSTPGEPKGRFYNVQRRAAGTEDWWVRRVTKEEMIACGRMSAEWAAQRAKQWGEENPMYLNRVEGEFAESSSDTVIPLAWIEAAQERWQEWKERDGWLPPLTTVGVDVGRTGDKTVLAPKHRNIIGELKRFPIGDTMMTTGRVIGVVAETQATAIVDVIGIGAGVFDRLKERKAKTGAQWDVRAFVASGKSPRLERSGSMGFVNQRADAWWNLREKLDPTYDDLLMLPPDDELTQDLTSPKYSVESGGRYLIEAKDRISERLGRSPDAGDAVVMACYEDKAPQARQEAESVQVTDSYGVRGFARRDRLFR